MENKWSFHGTACTSLSHIPLMVIGEEETDLVEDEHRPALINLESFIQCGLDDISGRQPSLRKVVQLVQELLASDLRCDCEFFLPEIIRSCTHSCSDGDTHVVHAIRGRLVPLRVQTSYTG
jgi:hypothetical protein